MALRGLVPMLSQLARQQRTAQRGDTAAVASALGFPSAEALREHLHSVTSLLASAMSQRGFRATLMEAIVESHPEARAAGELAGHLVQARTCTCKARNLILELKVHLYGQAVEAKATGVLVWGSS